MSIALAIDAATGDLILDDDGQVTTTEDPSPEILLAIGVPIGSVFAAPEMGSRIPGFVSGRRPPTSPNEIAQAAVDALARLQATGLITVESVTYDSADRLVTTTVAELADPLRVRVGDE